MSHYIFLSQTYSQAADEVAEKTESSTDEEKISSEHSLCRGNICGNKYGTITAVGETTCFP